ncbi:MAG: cytidine deaminase [Bacteroidales bacterium]|nr:cytidine deaminase [Bacteroidales bacterium]
MKQRAYTVRLYEYDQLEELSEKQILLVNNAIKAARDAYAPYSEYYVGAAIRLANGEIVIGSNQENAAYPSGLCAERVAIFYAGARYPDVPVLSIAIAAIRKGTIQEEPVAPCGACRQVLYEKESQGNTPMEVILYGSKKIQVINQVTDLLPLPFKLESLF